MKARKHLKGNSVLESQDKGSQSETLGKLLKDSFRREKMISLENKKLFLSFLNSLS